MSSPEYDIFKYIESKGNEGVTPDELSIKCYSTSKSVAASWLSRWAKTGFLIHLPRKPIDRESREWRAIPKDKRRGYGQGRYILNLDMDWHMIRPSFREQK